MDRTELRHLWLALLPFALACAARTSPPPAQSTGQTYAEALELICRVDERAGIDPDADPIGVEGARWDFIKAEVKNPDGVYFRTILEVKDAAEQAELLNAEVERVRLDDCPLLEVLESAGT